MPASREELLWIKTNKAQCLENQAALFKVKLKQIKKVCEPKAIRLKK